LSSTISSTPGRPSIDTFSAAPLPTTGTSPLGPESVLVDRLCLDGVAGPMDSRSEAVK
jgi:hypothetical protein